MKDNFPGDLTEELKLEGGFVNNPHDPGGATNKGITLATLSHWLGRAASVQEVKDLGNETVAAIYRSLYWNTVQGDLLPNGVDLIVFDEAVNSGPRRAAQTLQSAVGAKPDGVIGPLTIAAVWAKPLVATIDAFTQEHEAFYRSLPTFNEFGHGWLARLHEVAQRAMVSAIHSPVNIPVEIKQ